MGLNLNYIKKEKLNVIKFIFSWCLWECIHKFGEVKAAPDPDPKSDTTFRKEYSYYKRVVSEFDLDH